jgi:alkylation response protein AidB-like acyl-CoA dehydrogenase
VAGAPPDAALRAWRTDWRALTASALVGLAGAALEITTAYAKERQQFGRPIGAFQAIAHGLVDAATAVDGARLLAREAAWAVDTSDERATALSIMALRFAAETAERATTLGVHVHGGYGFMLEYDIQLLYRRAKVWALPIGTPEAERQRLADVLWAPPEVAA